VEDQKPLNAKKKKQKKNEMLHRVSDELFRRTKATENGHEICLSLIHPWRLTLFSFRIATLTSGMLFTTHKNDKIKKDKTGEAWEKCMQKFCRKTRSKGNRTLGRRLRRWYDCIMGTGKAVHDTLKHHAMKACGSVEL
jgi:hypothetical protein